MATDQTENVSYPEFRRAGREDLSQILHEQAPRTLLPGPADRTNAKLLAALSEAVALLEPAQKEIERLRAQLLEAKEAQRKVASTPLAVDMREAGSKIEPHGTLADRTEVQRQALRDEILMREKQRDRAWWRLGRWIPSTRTVRDEIVDIIPGDSKADLRPRD